MRYPILLLVALSFNAQAQFGLLFQNFETQESGFVFKDANARAYYYALEGAGYDTMADFRKEAIDSLFLSMKGLRPGNDTAYYDSISIAYLFIGYDSAHTGYNLIDTGAFKGKFQGSGYAFNNYYDRNSQENYMRTGFDMRENGLLDSASLSIGFALINVAAGSSNTSVTGLRGYDYASNTSFHYIEMQPSTGDFHFRNNGVDNDNLVSGSGTITEAFFIGSRPDASTTKAYNGTTINTESSTVDEGTPCFDPTLGSLNFASSATPSCGGYLQGGSLVFDVTWYFVGKGLSDAQMRNMKTDIDNFNTKFNR